MSIFSSVRIKKPKRNLFNLSHDVKLSCNMGELIPIICQPVVPGDTFKLNTEMLLRFAPLKAPVMHRVNVYTHFFFVPNRLIWDNWKEFITGGEDGNSSPSYPRIAVNVAGDITKTLLGNGSLADYLGFPNIYQNTVPTPAPVIDALPFRAYQLIYNEYYRDQNLQDEVEIYKDSDGVSNLTSQPHLLMLRKRCWQKDYFTSALPFTQRGDEVELPLQGQAPLINSNPGDYIGYTDPNSPASLSIWDPDTKTYKQPVGSGSLINNNGTLTSDGSTTAFPPDSLTSIQSPVKGQLENIKADLSKASSTTINELRRAIKAQEFLEVAARGGSRYIEQIFSYFGVKSSDARLQRPEYLGGGKQPVVISDVVQTSETTENSPQGTPSGNGFSLGRSNSFKRFFEEHGFVIGIMSVMPVPCYQQGMPRIFKKFDRLDYYWPQFAHLGEQAIENGELYYNPGNPAGINDKTFGYTPRYAEYKFIPSTVHGDFKSSLSFWHMGRIFSSTPNLNSQFVEFDATSSNRVFAVTDNEYQHLWVNIHHNLRALRPMPKFGTPRL